MKRWNIHPLKALALLAAAALGAAARADVPLLADQLPKELQGVGIVERLDETVPLDLPFKDENGKDVTLREYLKAGQPIILTPVYFNCPMLCNLTLNGLVDGLNEIELSAGKDFQIISFSFNPKEGPQLAEVKKRAYLTQYKRETAKDGWHFLTGTQETTEAMCKSIGFGYRYDETSREYAHTPTIMFLTPEGKLSRYMSNVMFEPRDLKFTLIEASNGAVGSPMDKFLLLMCYHYDPLRNSYAASAMKIMRLGGLVTLTLLATGLGFLWWKGSHHSRGRAEALAGQEVKQ